MGGRGTFASGNNVPFKYKTIGKVYDIKIIQGIGKLHGLKCTPKVGQTFGGTYFYVKGKEI